MCGGFETEIEECDPITYDCAGISVNDGGDAVVDDCDMCVCPPGGYSHAQGCEAWLDETFYSGYIMKSA